MPERVGLDLAPWVARPGRVGRAFRDYLIDQGVDTLAIDRRGLGYGWLADHVFVGKRAPLPA